MAQNNPNAHGVGVGDPFANNYLPPIELPPPVWAQELQRTCNFLYQQNYLIIQQNLITQQQNQMLRELIIASNQNNQNNHNHHNHQ